MTTISPETKTRRPWQHPLFSLGFGILIGFVILAIAYVPRAGWTSHDITTGRHSGYPDLTPRRYDMAPEQATRVAAGLASRIGGWRVVHLDALAGEMQAEAHFLSLLPAQSVTIKVRPTGRDNRYSEVLIRSRSTSGFGGDFGVNARHIRALQSAMDDKLPRAE